MSYDPTDHYQRLADNYDDTWGHRPDYVAWMNGLIFDRLRIQRGEHIADIGAGTGLFVQRLMDEVTSENPIVCIDPSQPMLDHLPEDPRLRAVCGSAEEVADGTVALPYDKLDAIVIKETIHHITDIPATIRGLTDRLVPGGRVLVVTLPPRLEYPLFSAALDRFAKHQPEPDDIAAAMRDAGLVVRLDYEAFPVRVDRDHYIDLVSRRWMSVLSTFDDAELAAGLREMSERHPPGELEFPDRFAFILGSRE